MIVARAPSTLEAQALADRRLADGEFTLLCVRSRIAWHVARAGEARIGREELAFIAGPTSLVVPLGGVAPCLCPSTVVVRPRTELARVLGSHPITREAKGFLPFLRGSVARDSVRVLVILRDGTWSARVERVEERDAGLALPHACPAVFASPWAIPGVAL